MKSPVPKCPWPGHDGSDVVFDGHYGKPGDLRQRYRCYPNGDRSDFHRFVESLPRQMTDALECDVCEHRIAATEGPADAARLLVRGAGDRSDPGRARARRALPVSLLAGSEALEALAGGQ